MLCWLPVSESELVIFLADSNKPYFKPKVNITKDILPRYVCIYASNILCPNLFLLVNAEGVADVLGWLCLFVRREWLHIKRSISLVVILMVNLPVQRHHHHQCGPWRLWWRLSDGCPAYCSEQIQVYNCFHLLGPQPDTRYSSNSEWVLRVGGWFLAPASYEYWYFFSLLLIVIFFILWYTF